MAWSSCYHSNNIYTILKEGVTKERFRPKAKWGLVVPNHPCSFLQVKEREAGNNNIYAQRARQPSKRSRRPGGDSLERSEVTSTIPTTSKSSLLTTTAGEDTRSKIEVASPRGRRISKESPGKSGLVYHLFVLLIKLRSSAQLLWTKQCYVVIQGYQGY